jgi:hypothetical protein
LRCSFLRNLLLILGTVAESPRLRDILCILTLICMFSPWDFLHC